MQQGSLGHLWHKQEVPGERVVWQARLLFGRRGVTPNWTGQMPSLTQVHGPSTAMARAGGGRHPITASFAAVQTVSLALACCCPAAASTLAIGTL